MSHVSLDQSVTIQPNVVNTIYSSSLMNSSPMYVRNDYLEGQKYYEARQVVVNMTGAYMFTSSSSMDTVGSLYQGFFDPSRQSYSQRVEDDESGGNGQFKFIDTLQAGVTYILVVTTYANLTTGPFSVTVSGPRAVSFLPANTTMSMTSPWSMYNSTSWPTYNSSSWSMYNSSSWYPGNSKSADFCGQVPRFTR